MPPLLKFLTAKNAGKAVAEPPKIQIGIADAFFLTYPRLKARQLFLPFSWAIAMDRRLSGAPSGTAQRDLLNGRNSWMKSIAIERHFLLTLYCCR
jgi:hypothetical protein